MLTGKNIVLGVSGGIAAYKMVDVASALYKLNANVHVILTENATKIIPPQTFEIITKNKCYVDTFDRDVDDSVHVPHISLGTGADLFLIAPASADIIGKLAHGIADDMLTTTVLPARCPMLLCPSMNVYMLENPIVQDNIETLKKYGYKIIDSATGYLACGYEGKGKLPDRDVLVDAILNEIGAEHDLEGKKVLVTAGPTREPIDPVRFISNQSTGKMGYALAKRAKLRGAEVTLVSGPVSLKVPYGVKCVNVETAQEMYQAVTAAASDMDIIIKSAAVADYTPAQVADNKIKKKDGDMSIPLVRTKDILKTLGETKKNNQFICGFSMETENVLENSRAKLEKKNVDMICANNLKVEGAGFKTDTNVVTIITKDETTELPKLSKEEVADEILNHILKHIS
jgi:phosphopantothenoylcysteine decarboxylase/phosphopantothenate--cysteine ligase